MSTPFSLLGTWGRRTFASLSVPNFRRYYAGQAVSLCGTWMQSVAQAWLVLELTGSGTAIGGVVAVQMLPTLVIGPYAGLVADRVDKRRLMLGLQAAMSLLAVVLGTLTITQAVRLWHVYLLAVLLGIASSFDGPARQSFVLEMVGPVHLRNAVSLTSVLINIGRALGPAAAGLVIAAVGTGPCFLANACTFLVSMTALATLDKSALHGSPRAPREKGQLRAGLSYVRRTRALAVPLIMIAIIGCLAYAFPVVLPILARDSFGGAPETFGFMSATMGIGSIVGGLVVAADGRTGIRPLAGMAAALGVTIAAAAVAPTLALEYVALFLVGVFSIGLLSTGSSTLQLSAEPTMRGRVMGLWSVAFLGSTPIGSPVVGALAERFGGRFALVIGALACAGAATFGALSRRRGDAAAPAPVPFPARAELD